MLNTVFKVLDWFIPEAARHERSELGLARNFVFTHLAGPALAQSLSVFLYLAEPSPGLVYWTVVACISSFWLLPFLLKFTGNMQLVAALSVQLLAFSALFGSYHYGGMSSPFLPWLIISLLLGFFYLSERPWLVIGLFSINILGFCAAYLRYGFSEHIPLPGLTTVGWISIMSATIYMSWMAIYYSSIITSKSEVERETERHRATAEQLRRVKEMAEQANRSKSIFLAKMSHELRTPLNAVIGYSEILLEDGEIDGSKLERLSDLKRINAAGKHLLSLVTDVLDLSQIEGNNMHVSRATFDLRQFAEEVAATSRPLIAEKGNRFNVKCADRIGTAATDQTKLRQSALNLLSNAAKFTEGGVITLELRRDRTSVGDWIEIVVQDTGIGISESDLPKLFNDFVQASASTSSQYGGTGLGLALSQKFCTMMGGGIKVQSELGRGSRFTIRVPATLPDAAEEAEPAFARALLQSPQLSPLLAG